MVSESPIRLLHITDTHIRSSAYATLLGVNTAHYFQKIIQLAFSLYRFDAVLMTGDLAQDPCVASYQFIYDTLAPYDIQGICLPGNHDDYALMQQVFNGNIHCRKQVLLGNWQIISLNSQIVGKNGGFLADGELAFLQRCLNDRPDHYALVAVHHHCLATQSRWMDTMIIQNHHQLLALLGNYYQAKALVHGHIHQQAETTVGHLQVLGTPSTCFQFKPESGDFELDDDQNPGFRVMELFSDGQIHSTVTRLPEALLGLQINRHGY